MKHTLRPTLVIFTCLLFISRMSGQDPAIAADRMYQEGMALSRQGSFEKAAEKLDGAARQYRAAGRKKEEALSLKQAGLVYLMLIESQKALERFEQALPLFQVTGDSKNQAEMLNRIGEILTWSDAKKARESFQQALSLFQKIGDQEGKMEVRNQLSILDSVEESHKALQEAKKLGNLADQKEQLESSVRDRRGEAKVLTGIDTESENGKSGAPTALSDEANKILQGIFKPGQTNPYMPTKLVEAQEKALQQARAVGDRGKEANILSNLGAMLMLSSEPRKAVAYLEQALRLFRALGDIKGEETTLNNINLAWIALGEPGKGSEFSEQAQKIRRAVRLQKASGYYEQALPVLKVLVDAGGNAAFSSRNSLDNWLTNQRLLPDEPEEVMNSSLRSLEESLNLAKAEGDNAVMGMTLNNIGIVLLEGGKPQNALKDFEQALQMFRKAGDYGGEAISLNNIGFVNSMDGNKIKAMEYFEASLPLFRVVGDRGGEATALNNLSALRRNSSPDLAVFFGKRAVNLLQQIRTDLQQLDSNEQRTFLRAVEMKYVLLANLLIARDRLPEAQQVINLAKDQGLLDSAACRDSSLLCGVINQTKGQRPLDSSGARNQQATVSFRSLDLTMLETQLDRRLQSLTQPLSALYQQYVRLRTQIGNRKPSTDEARQLNQLDAKFRADSEQFLRALKQIDNEFAKSTPSTNRLNTVAEMQEIQKTLGELNQRTGSKAVAIYTVTAPDNFRLLLITRDQIYAFSQPIKAADLNQKALDYLRLLQRPGQDPRTTAKGLYDLIFKPVEAELQKSGAQVLMWALDGALRYLPMSALYDGKQYLVERYRNVVFTRASSERMMAEVGGTWAGLGFGSSQPHTSRFARFRSQF